MPRLAAVLGLPLLFATSVAAAGPDIGTQFELRSDVLRYHLARGATPADACAVVVRYFGGACTVSAGRQVVITDTDMTSPPTFYMLIQLEPE